MEDYMSDKERVEWLRARVKEHAPWALAGILIAVAALFGFRQWQGWQQRQAATAAAQYSAGLDALSRADRDAAARIAADLRGGRSGPYADLLGLALARFDAENNRLADAEQRLSGLVKDARDEELRVVARLRLARVERAEGKADAALATLAGVPAGSGGPAFADVRGDVLADKGDKAGARKAWQEALAAATPGAINRELVELKIAALGPTPPAAPTPAPAPAPAAAAGGKP